MIGNRIFHKNPNITIKDSILADFPHINALLIRSGLLPIQVSEESVAMLVARLEDKIIGCGGWERYGKYALIRSIAVAPETQHQKLGSRLLEAVLSQLRDIGITDAYLLTETAAPFFLKHGFKEIPRASLPEIVRQSRQATSACGHSAITMHLAVAHRTPSRCP